MEIMKVHDHDYDTGYLHLSKTWYMIHEINIKELLTMTVFGYLQYQSKGLQHLPFTRT